MGTNLGRIVTLKLLPESHGGYSVKLAGICSLDDKIISLQPIITDTGEPADANPELVAGLRNGARVNGVLVAVTQTGARIFKPAAAKGATKSWDDFLCYRAAIVRFEAHTYALLGLFGDGCAKIFSIPGLKLIASTNVSHIMDVQRFSEAIITPTGYIFGWTGPSEMAALNIWGTGQDLTRSLDKLFNPEALRPPRPTISNVAWISGTQYVTPADMDKLIGGPDRPPSKRMIEQLRSDEQAQRVANLQPASNSRNPPPGRQDDGYWAYMQRQVQERTENLGLAGDNMDKLEENSQGFADDVGKFISQQKKKAVMGGKFYGSCSLPVNRSIANFLSDWKQTWILTATLVPCVRRLESSLSSGVSMAQTTLERTEGIVYISTLSSTSEKRNTHRNCENALWLRMTMSDSL